MSLIEQIKQANLEARKSKNSVAAALLTTLYSDIVTVGKNAGNRSTTEAEAVAVIKKFIKGVDETIAAFNGKEDSRLNSALIEKEILNKFLPVQLSETEIAEVVKSVISTIENASAKHMGQIMKHLKDNYSGQYDGALASKVIKQLLG